MRRIAIVFAAAGIGLVAAAGPAWAHVAVSPNSVPKGSDAVLAFVVPNEKDPATTTKVVVQFPHDHPIADALVEAIPGWNGVATQFKLPKPITTPDGTFNQAVDKVTWTATGAGIAVGHFQEFKVSLAVPDDTDSLAFPTIQTYSDGSTVNWVQVAPAGGPEPDSPEPVLSLTNPSGATTPTTAPASGNAAASTNDKSDDGTAKTIAIIALIVGGVGLLFGIGGIAAGRRRKA